MIKPSYIRRAAEIELAIITDWLYAKHKSIQNVINFFRYTCTVLNVPDTQLLETAVINYKKLMPTALELAVMSDLAPSRNHYIFSTLVANKMSRKTVYKLLRQSKGVDVELQPKLKLIISDTVIAFLKEFETLINDIEGFTLKCYNFEEE